LDKQKKTRALVEAALMATLVSIFTIVLIYIPILTPVIFLIPVPFMILGKRQGIHFTILSVIVWAMVIVSLIGPIQTMFMVVFIGGSAIVMGYMMDKKYTPFKILAGGMIAALLGLVLSITFVKLISGVDVINQVIEQMRMAMELQMKQMKMYKNMGMDLQQMKELEERLELSIKTMAMTIPAGMIIGSAFFAHINYVVAIRILKRIGTEIEGLPPLKMVRLPKSFFMGTLLIAVLTSITQYMGIVNFETLVINEILIFQLIYFVQGLAVVSYFLNHFKIKKILRIFIYMLLILSGSGVFMIAVMGLIDVLFNLRKL
jgi:uncharacterized protein YybS (DUF2232 family)